MPRENRKRGKKHKKQVEEVVQKAVQEEPKPTPSWILPRPHQPEVNAEAPFGYVDADVKAYFRTVDLQIREWQENNAIVQEDMENDPNEDRRLFLVAALKEMSDKERQLATDPDCSSILERMAYSMDDFTRRVFMDRLAGSYEELTRHRFASHVCQTMFSVARDTIFRESRGVLPPMPDSESQGELRTVTQLVLDGCEELLPSLSSLVMDPFASHVVRALLTVLLPHAFPLDLYSSAVRSKKSAAWKSHQGPMKSVFLDAVRTTEGTPSHSNPEFTKMACKFVEKIREDLNANEVRALAANQVASPVLKMLLEVEADQVMADEAGSLMDHVLVGLITLQKSCLSSAPEPSDYLTTLLRDPTSSHLLETLVGRTSESVFDNLWSTYFQGKLSRLAVHPVANFVVAKALSRVNEKQLQELLTELQHSWQKIIKSSRIGVVRAVVDRAAALSCQESEVMEAICSAFELVEEDRLSMVPCILRQISVTEYKDCLVRRESKSGDPDYKSSGRKKHNNKNTSDDPLEPKTQGALLLQSMLCLSSPHHECVLRSIGSMAKEELLEIAHHQTSSRVLDAIFDSSSVSIKAKHKLVMSFIGEFHHLVDDRIGSRVGDRCLLVADPYLKEKIVRSLLPYEHALAGSQYGKYFTKNLNLILFKRDPPAWKRMQSSKSPKQNPDQVAQTSTPVQKSAQPAQPRPVDVQKGKKRKRIEGGAGDDIDELFESALGGKKVRRAVSDGQERRTKPASVGAGVGQGLQDVLGAIRAAPKEDYRKKKHR